ncbi:MAG TPA: GNAT family N-acetyltransferase [Acidimicrobiia bacterium]|nr:GNAT family N-acetyltransferase [Acidimicrobiia bacterium]
MVELVKPDVRYEAGYRAAMREYAAEGRGDEGEALEAHPSFGSFVEELCGHASGRGLPPGWVASRDYWLVDGETYLGRVQVRAQLTDALRRYGGHVGYSIRPTARGKGHGTTALRLALGRCRALDLVRVLVTCDESNAASRRVIEANGGVLEDVVVLQGRPDRTMRYWIDVADDG